MDFALSRRSTREVLDDHLQCRMNANIEDDLARNYAPDVVILTSKGRYKGRDDVRALNRKLRDHVPHKYEIVVELTHDVYGFVEWRAREPGRSVEDGADSFVIRNGRIVFQSIHYTLQETMPL